MRPLLLLLLLLLLSLQTSLAFHGNHVHSFIKPYAVTNKVSIPRCRTTAVDVANGQHDTNEDVGSIKKGLTMEFFTIGVPAFVQLAAEPLAALVDTAYLGRLGPEVRK